MTGTKRRLYKARAQVGIDLLIFTGYVAAIVAAVVVGPGWMAAIGVLLVGLQANTVTRSLYELRQAERRHELTDRRD